MVTVIKGEEFIAHRETLLANNEFVSAQATLEWTSHWHSLLSEPPCAVVGEDGLYMPLCKYKEFGGEYSLYVELDCDHSLIHIPEKYIGSLQQILPDKTWLQPNALPELGKHIVNNEYQEGDVRCKLVCAYYHTDSTLEQLQARWGGKHRYNFKRDIRKAEGEFVLTESLPTKELLGQYKAFQKIYFREKNYRFDMSKSCDAKVLEQAMLDDYDNLEVIFLCAYKEEYGRSKLCGICILLRTPTVTTIFGCGVSPRYRNLTKLFFCKSFEYSMGRRLEPLSYDNGWKHSWGFTPTRSISINRGTDL